MGRGGQIWFLGWVFFRLFCFYIKRGRVISERLSVVANMEVLEASRDTGGDETGSIEDPSTHSEPLCPSGHSAGLDHSDEDGNVSQGTALPSCYADTQCIIWALKQSKTKHLQLGQLVFNTVFRVWQ